MAIETTVRRWGNSLGIIIPQEEVEKEDLEINDNIAIVIVKKGDLRNIFDTLKFKKSSQELKDMVREEWN